jgi:hypothetical protein
LSQIRILKAEQLLGPWKVSGCRQARRNADHSSLSAGSRPSSRPVSDDEAATGIGRETPPAYRNASLAHVRPSERQAPHTSLSAAMEKTPVEEKAASLSASLRPSGLQVTRCNQQHALDAALAPKSGRTSRQPDVNDTVHFGR